MAQTPCQKTLKAKNCRASQVVRVPWRRRNAVRGDGQSFLDLAYHLHAGNTQQPGAVGHVQRLRNLIR